MVDLPIVCTLDGDELRERRTGQLPGLLRRAVERVALADGYRWRFAPGDGLLSEIFALIDAERKCCRFLRFVVTTEPDLGPISLEITGPAGTTEFLDQLLSDAPATERDD
jgi:hypothetical protein